MITQDQSPLGWIGWISLQSKGLSRVFSNTTVEKQPFFGKIDKTLAILMKKENNREHKSLNKEWKR